MATRSARENKALNAKHTEMLRGMLRRPENRLCSDCKKNDPRWASTNLGCFLCIRCSGIHRSMGVHITRIKSIDLDTWTSDQVANVQRWGNKRANAYWEAHLRPGHIPPDHKMESFIRSKYESRRWAMEGPLPNPETLDDDTEEPAAAPAAAPSPSPSTHRASASTSKSTPASLPQSSLIDGPPATSPRSAAPPLTKPADPGTPNGTPSGGGGLFDLDFSPSATASAAIATAPAARKDVKNDILSLFSSPPAIVGLPAASGGASGTGGGGLWGPPVVAAPPMQSPIHAGGEVGGLTGQFGGLSMGGGAAGTAAASNPWGAFGGAPSKSLAEASQQQQAFGFGGNQPPKPQTGNLFGGAVDPWASTMSPTSGNSGGVASDTFGAFSSGTRPSGGIGAGKDAFSDIWK